MNHNSRVEQLKPTIEKIDLNCQAFLVSLAKISLKS